MTRSALILLIVVSISVAATDSNAAGDGERHLPHNHIALVVGLAFEEQNNGHRDRGNVLGVEYVRQVSKHWGWGAALEMEAFGNNNNREGILVIPVSYFPNDRWRLFAGPGIEFRKPGERDHEVFRVGAGYEFKLGKGFALSPELVVDFVSGGTTVYVVGFSLGYGF